VHEWRSGLLHDDPILLRVHDRHDEVRLHLLCLDEQHAGLLRLLSSSLEQSQKIVSGPLPESDGTG
jgi:hypothetical protein